MYRIQGKHQKERKERQRSNEQIILILLNQTNKEKIPTFEKMADMDQFADLELSKEDREQIFEPPTDRQQHPVLDPSSSR